MSGGSRRPFSLGNRLSLCASLVRTGSSLADVGTDHAYLPIWLAGRGLIRSAVASDLRPGPLKRARANILRYGVENLVTVRLSDGLESIDPQEAEDVVIAGMGGLMMIHILEQAPWLRSEKYRVILQPMTSAEELRIFLAHEGFAVLRECAAEEGGHVYTAMQVSYRPQDCARGELYPYVGSLTAETGEGRHYLTAQKKRLEKRAEGLRKAGNTWESERLFGLARQIGALLFTEKRS